MGAKLWKRDGLIRETSGFLALYPSFSSIKLFRLPKIPNLVIHFTSPDFFFRKSRSKLEDYVVVQPDNVGLLTLISQGGEEIRKSANKLVVYKQAYDTSSGGRTLYDTTLKQQHHNIINHKVNIYIQ